MIIIIIIIIDDLLYVPDEMIQLGTQRDKFIQFSLQGILEHQQELLAKRFPSSKSSSSCCGSTCENSSSNCSSSSCSSTDENEPSCKRDIAADELSNTTTENNNSSNISSNDSSDSSSNSISQNSSKEVLLPSPTIDWIREELEMIKQAFYSRVNGNYCLLRVDMLLGNPQLIEKFKEKQRESLPDADIHIVFHGTSAR